MRRPGVKRLFRFVGRTPQVLRDEVDEEIRLHLDLRVEALVAAGMSEPEARRRALIEFGDRSQAVHDGVYYQQRLERRTTLSRWVDELQQDIRLGVRSLRRAPFVTAASVLILAVGVGASTAAFSALNGVAFSRLPYPDADELVSISMQRVRDATAPRALVHFNDMEEWQRGARHIHAIAGAAWGWEWNSPVLVGHGYSRRMTTAAVTDTFFSVLGTAPSIGRTFTASDMSSACVLVLSHRFWASVLGGGPVVGGSLTLDQRSCLVIGVMPPSFEFQPRDIDGWTLITRSFQPEPTSLYIAAVARLSRGASAAQAQAELRMLYRARHAGDRDAESLQPTVGSVREEFSFLAGPGLKGTLWLSLAAAGLLLAIACLNVAGLFGARMAERAHEMAVRVAMGSGRRRLVRQVFVESILLAITGGIGGLFVAFACIRALLTRSGVELPVGADVRLDLTVLSFCVACCIALAVTIGVIAARRSTATDPSSLLRSRKQGYPGGQRLARLLLVTQTAFAVVLLFVSTLLVTSAGRMAREDLGYSTDGILAVPMGMSQERYRDAAARTAFFDRTAEVLASLPGVADVAFVSLAPPRTFTAGVALVVSDRPAPEPGRARDVVPVSISTSYFDVLGVPLVAGRPFNRNDRVDAEPVAIVNQALARAYFPHGTALGKRIRIAAAAPWRTVVGIVGNEKEGVTIGRSGWLEPPVMFMPAAQNSRGSTISVLIKAQADVPSVSQIQRALASADPLVSVGEPQTVGARVSNMTRAGRLRATMLAAVAFFALVLISLGLYALMTEFVRQRTRDIGIRLALGGTRWDVARDVLAHGGGCVVAGLILGGFSTHAITAAISRFLYGVEPADPAVIGAVGMFVLGSVVAALWRPLLIATRVDPIVALHAE